MTDISADGLQRIDELEKLASNVLKLKSKVIPRRPIVIEFCGSPKSGKTSCISSLDLFLRRNNFRTRVLTERASVCPVSDKYDPLFNIWTVTSAVAELSEVLANDSKNIDIVIMDRGIFDALCWFRWLKSRGHFDENNFRSIEAFLLMPKWRAVIDLIYAFDVTPEVSLKREFANLLTRKTGSIMHPNILESYREEMMDTISHYKGSFKRIESMNTSETPLEEVNYRVTKNTLQIINESTSEKIGFFDRAELDNALPEFFDFSALRPNIVPDFAVRDTVEADNEKIQPIPILVVTNQESTEILVVKKNRSSTSVESPEAERLLLYLGGHIRKEDMIESDSDDLREIASYALHREVKEEIGFDYYPSKDVSPLCFWVRSNPRSERHFAMCHVLKTDLANFRIRLDKNEFVTHSSSKSGKILKISEVMDDASSLEDWSKLILRKVFNQEFDQRELYSE